MRSLSCLAFGLAFVFFPIVAHAQDGHPPFQIAVCNDGTIKVVDSRTGKEVPCVVMRAADKPPVVRIVEGPATIVRELALDKHSGNLIRVPRDRMLPPHEAHVGTKQTEVEKQLEKALKELEARRKVEEEHRLQAEKALAEFRKQAEDARILAEKQGQEALKELQRFARKQEEETRKKEIEARDRAERQLAETRKELDKFIHQHEQEARKKDEDARRRVEKQLDDARKELEFIGRMKKEEARKQEQETRKQAERDLEESRNAKLEQLMKEIRDLRKDNDDLKKRLDAKPKPAASPSSSSDFPWQQFNLRGGWGGWDKDKKPGAPKMQILPGGLKIELEGKLDAKDLKQLEDLLKKHGIPAELLKMLEKKSPPPPPTPPAPAPKQAAAIDLEARLDRILEEAEALRREILKAKSN